MKQIARYDVMTCWAIQQVIARHEGEYEETRDACKQYKASRRSEGPEHRAERRELKGNVVLRHGEKYVSRRGHCRGWWSWWSMETSLSTTHSERKADESCDYLFRVDSVCYPEQEFYKWIICPSR